MAYKVSFKTDKKLAKIEFMSEKANTLERGIINEIIDNLNISESNKKINAVLISSVGDKVFSSGADLREYKNRDAKQIQEYLELLGALFSKIMYFSKPVIVKIKGISIGGALGLIASSDYSLCAQTSKFYLPELKLGIAPSVITPFLLNRIGSGHLKNISFGGRKMDSSWAEKSGLISEVVSDDELDKLSLERSQEISDNPYSPIKKYKQILTFDLAELEKKLKEYSKVNAANIIKAQEEGFFSKKG